MAYDPVTLNTGVGGADVASDTVDDQKIQIVKLDGGGEDASIRIIAGRNSDAESLPVALSDEDVALIDGLETAIASTNTKLDTVIAALSTIDGRVDGLEALITTQAGYLDGIEALIGTTNTNTGNSATSLGALDNAVAGNELQVDVVAALPAGSNSIGAVTNTHLTNFGAGEYETVAASQTGQVLGATGGTGDFVSHIIIIPASVSPGNVLLLDNATSITVFAGGTDSVLTLHPFTVDLRMISVSGAWKITTGANVSVIGVGNFT